MSIKRAFSIMHMSIHYCMRGCKHNVNINHVISTLNVTKSLSLTDLLETKFGLGHDVETYLLSIYPCQ